MTAYTAIETMVRNVAATDLKLDPNIQKIISDMDRLEEIEDGTLRAEKREELAQHIIAFLLGLDYVTEETAFDLLNKSNTEFGYSEIVDKDFGEEEPVDDDDYEDDEEDMV